MPQRLSEPLPPSPPSPRALCPDLRVRWAVRARPGQAEDGEDETVRHGTPVVDPSVPGTPVVSPPRWTPRTRHGPVTVGSGSPVGPEPRAARLEPPRERPRPRQVPPPASRVPVALPDVRRVVVASTRERYTDEGILPSVRSDSSDPTQPRDDLPETGGDRVGARRNPYDREDVCQSTLGPGPSKDRWRSQGWYGRIPGVTIHDLLYLSSRHRGWRRT